MGVFGRLACMALGAGLAASAGGAAITGVNVSVDSRTASYLTGTASVAVDDAAEIALTLATDADITAVTHTLDRTAAEAGTVAFALDHLCPGTTYYVRAVATDGNGVAATNDTSFAVGSSMTQMCFKPDSGKTSYPWDTLDKWYANPGSGEGLGYAPSLGDDVLLYSSKNDLLTRRPPMTIGNGVHAETRMLTLANENYAQTYCIGVTVQGGGTLTNASHVYIGKSGIGKIGAGAIKVEDGGEWTANQFVMLGNSSGTSRIEIAEGGTFNCGGEFVVGNNHGMGVATNTGTMNLYDLFVGNGTCRGVLENRGVINVTRKVTFGRNAGSGDGYVHLAAGSVFNKRYTEGKPLFLGHTQNATVELEGTINFLDKSDQLRLGSNAAGVLGRLVMDGAAVVSNLTELWIGSFAGGLGKLEMKGDSAFVMGTGNRMNVYVGHDARSYGELRMRDNATMLFPNRLQLAVGASSTGVVELAGNAVVSNVNVRLVTVGAQTNTWASLTVADNARLCGTITNLSVGVMRNSWGELRLRGGSVSLYAPNSAAVWQLYLGYDDANGTHGQVRGWGRFVKDGVNEMRLTTTGQYIADGEGEERDLDLSVFRTCGTGATGSVNACGSNGWYAVNGGRLFYPRTQNCTANQMSHPTLGDYPTRTDVPRLVNSLRFNMTTPPSSQYYNYVALYAPDRGDIPALPTGTVDRVQGVLRVGTAKTLTPGAVEEPPNPIGFAGCGFTLRYDLTGLDVDADEKPYRMRLYRHDGTENGVWTKLTEQEHDPASPFIGCLDHRFNPSASAWNWGWFAVVAHRPEKGLTLVVR